MGTRTAFAIETHFLTKIFPSGPALFFRKSGSRAAVDQVSLAIRPGEIFGLLGPNGAGKTTLLKLLATLILPTSGSARINGHELADAEAVRASLALVTSDERSFYWRLTGRQNLEFFAALYQLETASQKARIAEVLNLVGLKEAADLPVKAYSSGMKQRLALARALLPQKPIMLLDEPTKGLDPAATRQLHRLIREELAAHLGVTVILATHQLWEAEALCHRLAVMYQGRVQGCGTPQELRRDLNLPRYWRLALDRLPPNLPLHLQHSPSPVQLNTQEGQVVLKWAAGDESVKNRLLSVILQSGANILSLSQEEASLEEIFGRLTQKPRLPAPGLGEPEARKPPDLPENQTNPSQLTNTPSGPLRKALRTLRHCPRLAAAFLKRDFLEEWSYRLSFIFQFLIIFFSVTMFYFLGQLFGATVNPYLAPYEVDYFSFVLVGLAFSRYFDVSLATFYQSLRTAQTTGTLEAMFNTPTSISLMVLSSSLWSYLFTSFQVLVYLGVGAILFGARLDVSRLPAVLVILMLTIVSFASLGILAAALIMVYKKGDPVVWLFTTLAGLLGGIYYPVSLLPTWLRPLAQLLPITPALEALRLTVLKGQSLESLLPQVLLLTVSSLVLLPLSLMSFRLAVKRAKVDGSLSHY